MSTKSSISFQRKLHIISTSLSRAHNVTKKVGDLYPYVCQGDSKSKVDWEGMVWGIENTILPLIDPAMAPVATVSTILKYIHVRKTLNTVVSRFSELSRFSGLKAGKGAWSHHKSTISF